MKFILLTLLSVLVGHATALSWPWQWFSMPDPEVGMSTGDLIRHAGYGRVIENVWVDDYRIEMFRIPCTRKEGHSCVTKDKPPVFIMHGVIASSADWILNLPDQNLPYILADAGYDVWLGNVRGNVHGRYNKHLSPDSPQFWDFTFDEHAQRDLPAMVDHILQRTGRSELYYVGHSQGCAIMLQQASLHPEFGKKIKHFFALAPVATVDYLQGPLSHIAPKVKSFNNFLRFFGVREFTVPSWLEKVLANLFCFDVFGANACESMVFFLAGPDSKEMNSTRLPVYISHDPAGTSVLNMVHWGQMYNSHKFQLMDYGAEGNRKRYGQTGPPEVPLRNFAVNTSMFHGGRDWLATPKDIAKTIKPLPAIQYTKYFPTYNHVDFLWALDAKTTIFSVIAKQLDMMEAGHAIA